MQRRARAIAARLEAGMSSINDFNATYMCQRTYQRCLSLAL